MKTDTNSIGESFVLLIMIITWLMGLVLAKGFWQTIFAFFPPYAWYLVVEQFLKHQGWI